MASLKTIKVQYYIRFRVLGDEKTKALGTSSAKEAEAKKGRIEHTIFVIVSGRLAIFGPWTGIVDSRYLRALARGAADK